MIDKFCTYLTNKIRKEMPEVDDERAEVINYGIQLIIGEIPKIILLFAIAFILRVGWLTMFAFFAILPYKKYSGGFHLKTHLGCIAGTCLFYFFTVYMSKYYIFDSLYLKYIIILLVAAIINNNVLSNILLLGTFLQTISITKIAYKITRNKYGYEAYNN